MLIKGFNLEQDLRPTPQTRGEVSHAPDYYKKLLMAVSSDVGYMFRYAAKPKHDFIDDVSPVKQDKEKQLGTNSIFLDWHVEDAFHPIRPDYVGLFCIRGDRNAQTLIFDAKTYVNHTEGSPDIAKYKYKFIADGTFQSGEKYSTEMPVLENSIDPQITFDPSFMITYAEEAESALRRFGEFVDKNHHVITLEPGDLLIFDNRRVAHSRTAYHPKFDGSNRWLIRSLIIESTWKFKDFASTHPFVIGEKKTWQV
ncbi:TauD/TfdA family dioxygenase [Yokenella regensburgei]|uniref:TauD/TfdA family dioxygenase n=1 Tax=Yokenella regensburgei TaxID=158877 RepID=UPI001375AD12|nr:TauD/TfdA family dioxygenase [Yokenella regensburgei]KAF1366604.1 hypothetical protein FHR25_004933 [Yokenella regensburgei]